MLNIYLIVTFETFSKLRFSRFKFFFTRSVFGELQLTKISLNFRTSCCNLKIRGLGAYLCGDISTVLERRTLCFSSCKNRKLKVKLWWIRARERKKRTFFLSFILSKGNFFKICVLSQCILYWIQFQNIHTFTYQKILLYELLFLTKHLTSF